MGIELMEVGGTPESVEEGTYRERQSFSEGEFIKILVNGVPGRPPLPPPSRQFPDELFECVWPFCRVGA